MKYGKRMKDVTSEFTSIDRHEFMDAFAIMEKGKSKNFDETVELSFNLGVNPKKSDQMIRGACILPSGTGKTVRVLAIVPADKIEEAKAAGADFVGNDEYIEKIQKEGWIDFDKMVTVPAMMKFIGKLGKVLGRRGLMPTPKLGTVSNDIAGAIKLVKAGRVEFKINKDAVLSLPVGKMSFGADKLYDNVLEVVRSIMKLKPTSAKGTYVKKLSISSTMGPGVRLDEIQLINKSK